MPTVNHRLSSRQRQAKAVARSKPAVRRRADIRRHETILKRKRWLGVLVLLPLLVVSVFALAQMLFRATLEVQFWRTAEFVFFMSGCLAWATAYGLGWRPLTTYVFAHEATHALMARLWGGQVLDWHVSREGGYVETNKSNTWITLGPYLVPFYSVLVMLLFGAVSLWVDLSQWRAYSLAGMHLHFRLIWLLYFLVGFTWSFHLTFTAQTVRAEQGDLIRNGEFFSMLLIVLVNLALIGGLFVIASPDISFMDVAHSWMDAARGLWQFVESLFA